MAALNKSETEALRQARDFLLIIANDEDQPLTEVRRKVARGHAKLLNTVITMKGFYER